MKHISEILNAQAYNIGTCRYHGHSLFKLGFCVQCINECNAEESDDALARIAERQLEVQREVAPEVDDAA